MNQIKKRLLGALFLAGIAPLAAHAQANDPNFAAHPGGTLKLVSASAGGSIDPQVNYTKQYWQTFIVAYDGLVTFKKTSGDDSNDVVPDLAVSIPQPQDGGKTYVFTLRKGIKFSNGATVTPDDVVASFERLFKVNSPNAGSWYEDIAGADTCLTAPASCTLPNGVIADDKNNTVTFHLTRPNPEFLYQLAVPFAAILPASTPAKDTGTTPVPSTGPYMVTSYDPKQAFILMRNPYFKEWCGAAQPQGYPDEIDYDFGVTVEDDVTAIENGQADWVFDPPPSDRLNEIGTSTPRRRTSIP